MKFKPSFAFDELSGKAGSVVAVNNKKNPFLRPRISPTNPNTSSQQNVRGDLAQLSQGWAALSDAQRLAWENAVIEYKTTGIFGNKRNPSGFNLYMKLNGNLLDCGAPVIYIPALKQGALTPVLASVVSEVGNSTVTVTFTEIAVPADRRYIIRGAALRSVGKKVVAGDFRNLQIVAAAANPSANKFTEYTTKFGALVAGKRISVQAVAVNTVTGEKSQPIMVEAVVSA